MAGEFQIPKFISAEGKDLLKNVLNIDPNKRFRIDDIRSHKWFKCHSKDENFQ